MKHTSGGPLSNLEQVTFLESDRLPNRLPSEIVNLKYGHKKSS